MRISLQKLSEKLKSNRIEICTLFCSGENVRYIECIFPKNGCVCLLHVPEKITISPLTQYPNIVYKSYAKTHSDPNLVTIQEPNLMTELNMLKDIEACDVIDETIKSCNIKKSLEQDYIVQNIIATTERISKYIEKSIYTVLTVSGKYACHVIGGQPIVTEFDIAPTHTLYIVLDIMYFAERMEKSSMFDDDINVLITDILNILFKHMNTQTILFSDIISKKSNFLHSIAHASKMLISHMNTLDSLIKIQQNMNNKVELLSDPRSSIITGSSIYEDQAVLFSNASAESKINSITQVKRKNTIAIISLRDSIASTLINFDRICCDNVAMLSVVVKNMSEIVKSDINNNQ